MPNLKNNLLLDIDEIAPQVSWGTNPGMTCDVTESSSFILKIFLMVILSKKRCSKKLLLTWILNLEPLWTDIKIDRVFIGSCTNARLEDLIEAAKVVKVDKKFLLNVKAMVVPGSQLVKKQAEEIRS